MELGIGDTIRLCKLPVAMNEVGTTELLKAIVLIEDNPVKNQITDVRLWTVQERALVVGHYLSQTSEFPDFEIGKNTYSNYLQMDRNEVKESIDLGMIAGDKWTIRPLLGVHAEAIERLIEYGHIASGREGWWFGAMAAMLYPESVADVLDAELDEYLQNKVAILKGYPERDFMELFFAFLAGCEKLDHFFTMTFLDEGIAWEAPGIPPARFQFTSAVSEMAYSVFGVTAETSARIDPALQPDSE